MHGIVAGELLNFPFKDAPLAARTTTFIGRKWRGQMHAEAEMIFIVAITAFYY